MTKFIMECELHGTGPRTRLDLQNIADHFFAIVEEFGPCIRWIESHITQEKLYGVFIADHELIVRQLAFQVGLPVSQITQIKESLSPTLIRDISTE